MSIPLSLSLMSSSRGIEDGRSPLRKRRVCSCSRSWFWRSWLAAAAACLAAAPGAVCGYTGVGAKNAVLVTSPDGPDAACRLRMLPNRRREKGRGPWDCIEQEGMPESWWCRGARCSSMLGLRVAVVEGRDSMKLCIEPRRGVAAEFADENDESRRRVFWRVNWPVTAPNARVSELACECWAAMSSRIIDPSLTASSAMPASLTSW
jgi:hypothetical protein